MLRAAFATIISIALFIGLAAVAPAAQPPDPRATITPGPSPTNTPTPICPGCQYVALIRIEIQPTATATPERCAAEYPTVCIPPPPPDLDCGEIEFDNFTALPPDRHQFDTDRDGIGCER